MKIFESPNIEFAVVVKVFPRFAFLKLESKGQSGFLHISNLSENFNDPPLSNHLLVGQRLTVAVLKYNEEYKSYNVSCKAYERYKKCVSSGIEIGKYYKCEIKKVTEFGAFLTYNGGGVYLPSSPTPWASYKVLHESGRLTEGSFIDVSIVNFDSGRNVFLAQLIRPDFCLDANHILQSRVIFFRSSYLKKNRLQSVIYTVIDDRFVFRINVSIVNNPEEIFLLGSTLPVRPKNYNIYTNMLEGDIAWELTKVSHKIIPRLGEVFEAKVFGVAPYGALCLLRDRVVGFMHKSSISSDTIERLESYLSPGDVIEVKVTDANPRGESDCAVSFVRLLLKSDVDDKNEGAELLDLYAKKNIDVKGGYSRDASFRSNVLEAYKHKCCICGSQFSIAQSSAMEAAHIIPRAKRGSDILQNSLCLCPVHHWAFDRGYIAIDSDGFIRVSSMVIGLGRDAEWLANFDGERAHLVREVKVSFSALAWHEKNVFIEDVFQ